MDPALISLIAACTAFVGMHFVLSHPLRAGLIRRLGENGFMGVYSLVAFATLGWAIAAFAAVGPQAMPLWDGGSAGLWIIASLVTFVALALLLGSLHGNPALPQTPADKVGNAAASGVFAITRHPMMWGIALWALAHMLVAPKPRTLILMAAMIVLALVGSHLQDRKKAVLLGDVWQQWESRTSFWPRLSGLGGLHPLLWLVTVLAWLAATWAHMPLAYITAGVWRWMG